MEGRWGAGKQIGEKAAEVLRETSASPQCPIHQYRPLKAQRSSLQLPISSQQHALLRRESLLAGALPPPRIEQLIYLAFLSFTSCEFLRPFRDFAAHLATPPFAQRRICPTPKAFARASLICALWWYGSLWPGGVSSVREPDTKRDRLRGARTAAAGGRVPLRRSLRGQHR